MQYKYGRDDTFGLIASLTTGATLSSFNYKSDVLNGYRLIDVDMNVLFVSSAAGGANTTIFTLDMNNLTDKFGSPTPTYKEIQIEFNYIFKSLAATFLGQSRGTEKSYWNNSTLIFQQPPTTFSISSEAIIPLTNVYVPVSNYEIQVYLDNLTTTEGFINLKIKGLVKD